MLSLLSRLEGNQRNSDIQYPLTHLEGAALDERLLELQNASSIDWEQSDEYENEIYKFGKSYK